MGWLDIRGLASLYRHDGGSEKAPQNEQENHMARNATNPLAAALDKRIRAIVEESIEKIVRDEVRSALREELSVLLGTISSGAPAAAMPRRRAGKAIVKAKAKAARKGRARKAEASGEQATCGVAGCGRPYRSRGYCAAHYQAARKYGWPMPPPADFVPPPRPARGRPPKS